MWQHHLPDFYEPPAHHRADDANHKQDGGARGGNEELKQRPVLGVFAGLSHAMRLLGEFCAFHPAAPCTDPDVSKGGAHVLWDPSYPSALA